MIRVDGYFFYQLGAALRPLVELGEVDAGLKAWLTMNNAKLWVGNVMQQNVAPIKTGRWKGSELLRALDENMKQVFLENTDGSSLWDGTAKAQLANTAKEFEVIVAAELAMADFYAVSPKGAFDTSVLAEQGERAFSADLALKVPSAIEDARQAARCIAFDLPTAAAFHLHRVNETVLRYYFKAVAPERPEPVNRTLGAFIESMKNIPGYDKKVVGALASLKNFHRNPVIHPDDSLSSSQEAISLYGSVQAVVGYMLEVIPSRIE